MKKISNPGANSTTATTSFQTRLEAKRKKQTSANSIINMSEQNCLHYLTNLATIGEIEI